MRSNQISASYRIDNDVIDNIRETENKDFEEYCLDKLFYNVSRILKDEYKNNVKFIKDSTSLTYKTEFFVFSNDEMLQLRNKIKEDILKELEK